MRVSIFRIPQGRHPCFVPPTQIRPLPHVPLWASTSSPVFRFRGYPLRSPNRVISTHRRGVGDLRIKTDRSDPGQTKFTVASHTTHPLLTRRSNSLPPGTKTAPSGCHQPQLLRRPPTKTDAYGGKTLTVNTPKNLISWSPSLHPPKPDGSPPGMPAFVNPPPDSNVTLEATSSRRLFETYRAHHIYLAFGTLVFFLVIRLVTTKLRVAQPTHPWDRTVHKPETEYTRESKDPSRFDSKQGVAASWGSEPTSCRPNHPYFSPGYHGTELGLSSPLHQSGLIVGLPSPAAQAGLIGPSWQTPAMDDDVREQRKDRSGSATSRGVSTNERGAAGIRHQLTPSRSGTRSVSSAERRTTSRSSRYTASQASSSRHPSDSANGADSLESGKGDGKGNEPMTRQESLSQGAPGTAPEQDTNQLGYGGDSAWPGLTESAGYPSLDNTSPWEFARPPPPPPLTPPTFNDPGYPFESRRLSYAVSNPPELDGGFTNEVNTDYRDGSTPADIQTLSSVSAIGIPRRTSYTRSIPIGIPTPATSASSSAETIASSSAFSPSSFPPSGPILPPPPPGSELPYDYQFVGGPGGPGIFYSEEVVDLHGEILSVVDDGGHGWMRHTRVYGGGVCLACIGASGEGGFYGDTVPLEDRR